MLTDITIGQYFPGTSVLHKMDPRMKLSLTVLFMVMVFLPQNWYGLAAVAALVAATVALSRLPIKLVWRSVRPILILVVFTSILNMLYVTGGDTLVQWGFIHITTKGIQNAVFISVRIVCLIIGSSLLTYTTTPTSLTDAIEILLSPLRIIHINAHELAMMMTIALRFIPTLMEETGKIMAAQKARGADMESGNLLQRVRALVPIIVPLFVSSFRRAYELAMAMECRCYHGGDGRTRMKQLRTARRDWVALAILLIYTAALIVCNRSLGSIM